MNKAIWVEDYDYRTTSRIVAWMPLPEPYKAESEDKEWEK